MNLDASAGKLLTPIQERAAIPTTMPGVSDIVAQVIVAEIGVDMSRFPTAAHLVSWAGLCPRNDESAGTLVTAALAASRRKESCLRSQFLRIKSRRGAKKAILSVAAAMITACFYMLRDGVEYSDLGAQHFDRRDKAKTINRLVRRLNDLGCQVELTQAA